MDSARDELFSHIMRCGVLEAEEDERRVWMSDTVEFLGERYPDLTRDDLQSLSDIGHRYCQPAIPHGPVEAPRAGGAGPQPDEVNVA
ncbi:MAG: hypothetical protein ACE5HF_05040 [Gemmatimonadota bacterium]